MEALSPEQLGQMLTFINKATGWLIVASGAFLLAIEQTWALRELFGWPVLVFWALVIVLLLLCVGYVTSRMLATEQVLHGDKRTKPIASASTSGELAREEKS